QLRLDAADEFARQDEGGGRPCRGAVARGGRVVGLVASGRPVDLAGQDAGGHRFPGRRGYLEGDAVVDAEVVELLGLAEEAQTVECQAPAGDRLGRATRFDGGP